MNREIELEKLLSELSPDIAVLTETELPVSDTTFAVRDYSVHFPDSVRDKYRLLVLTRENLGISCTPTIIHKSGADLWIKLDLPTTTLAIGGIYRQWGSVNDEQQELAAIHQHVAVVTGTYKRAIAVGDFNLDYDRRGDTAYYRHSMIAAHLSYMDSMGFKYMGPYSATYNSHGCFKNEDGSTSRRSSTLDHVYALGLGSVDVHTHSYAATDHYPVVLEVPTARPPSKVRHVSRRNYNGISSTDLLFALNAGRLSKVFQYDDVNLIHRVIVEEIIAALDVVAPIKTSVMKYRQTPLNLKGDTLAAMEARDRAAKQGDLTKYRDLRNRAGRLLRRDKLDSNQNFLAGNDPKRVWALANSAMGKGGSALPKELDGVSGDRELADHVNRYYVSKISKLRSSIPRVAAENGDSAGDVEEKLELHPPTVPQVAREIMGLKNTSAEGVDGIPVVVLKLGVEALAEPITHLIATSIRTATVPDGFKKSNVIPIYKKKKPLGAASSYRPVSILPALSKVMERVVHKQLMEFMDKKLPNSQHGFRPRRNTVGAIIAAQGSWQKERSAGHVVGIAAYDLSSAFDTLDHSKLVSKLCALGIRGKSLKWFEHYLQNRSQRVVYNDESSGYLDIEFGVPQGSILGPLLFLCLLTDLPPAIEGSVSSYNNKVISVGSSGYADDCVAWVAAEDLESVREGLESISRAISDYMSHHYLVLNHEKTQVVIVGNGGSSSSSSPSATATTTIMVGETSVQASNCVDMLGVTFDDSLSSSPHTQHILGIARTLAGASRRLSHHLRQGVLQQVIRALVVGRVGYGCAVLQPRLKDSDPLSSGMRAVQTAVNDCARAIIGSRRSERVPVECLLERSGLPSVNRMIVEQIALETWKGLNYNGNDGTRVPIGQILRPPSTTSTTRLTRAASSNCIPPPPNLGRILSPGTRTRSGTTRPCSGQPPRCPSHARPQRS